MILVIIDKDKKVKSGEFLKYGNKVSLYTMIMLKWGRVEGRVMFFDLRNINL